MRDILAEIVEAKKDVVAKAKEQLPLQQVKKLAKAHVGCFPMNYRFKANGWGLIAECKLQSPSKGNLPPSYGGRAGSSLRKSRGCHASVHTDAHF